MIYSEEDFKDNLLNNIDFTEINIGNGIKWNVNDRCNHNIFGKGTVTRVDGDIIDVTFDDFGNKKLLGSHKALSKIED